MDLQAERTCRLPGASRHGVGVRVVRIHEHAGASDVGDELMDQPERFLRQVANEKVYAGNIAVRSVEARDQAELNRIDPEGKNNRYSRRRCLRGEGWSGRTCRKDGGHPAVNQIDRYRGQSIILAVRPAVLDGEIFAFDETGFFEAASEC